MKKITRSSHRLTHYKVYRIYILALLSLPLILFLAVPLLSILFRMQPSMLASSIESPEVIDAIKLSLFTSMLSTILTVVFGTPLAYLIARFHFWGRTIIDTLIDLPLVLPPLVVGIALLITLGRRSILGQVLNIFGFDVPFTPAAVILAQLFLGAPLYVRSAVAGFTSIDLDYELAAALDGANEWQVTRFITLPLAAPSLISGVVISWARVLGEFGATIIFAGNLPGYTQTIPLAIYMSFEVNLDMALTLSLILMIISLVILVAVKNLLGRQLSIF